MKVSFCTLWIKRETLDKRTPAIIKEGAFCLFNQILSPTLVVIVQECILYCNGKIGKKCFCKHFEVNMKNMIKTLIYLRCTNWPMIHLRIREWSICERTRSAMSGRVLKCGLVVAFLFSSMLNSYSWVGKKRICWLSIKKNFQIV